MYEQIASNKRKSLVIIILFLLLIFFLGWILGEFTGLGKEGIVLALIISFVATFSSYYYSDRIVLAISKAKPVTKREYPYLYNVVEGLSIAAGLPKPRCYIIEDSSPNAFATGRNPKNSVIVVTTGLLEKLNRVELEGVIAHEMAHIKNYDILLGTITVVMVGIAVLLSDWILRTFFWTGGRRSKKIGKGNAGTFLLLIGIIFALLAPFVAQLMRLAISRRREFMADASGVLLTRYPPGLISALKKLDSDTEPLEVANKATAHLYIVNPLKDIKGKINKLFSTHPPIEERISALEKM
jgi:heat shock protein HtpX